MVNNQHKINLFNDNNIYTYVIALNYLSSLGQPVTGNKTDHKPSYFIIVHILI